MTNEPWEQKEVQAEETTLPAQTNEAVSETACEPASNAGAEVASKTIDLPSEAEPTDTQAGEEAPPEEKPDPAKIHKAAYTRSGLSVLTLYLIMQFVGGLVAAFILIPIMMYYIMQPDMIQAILYGEDPAVSFSQIAKLLSSETLGSWIIAASMIGTGVGLGIGILVQRMINKKIEAEPIEKRTLRGGTFAFYLLITLGLWGIGVYAGNLPSFFGLDNVLDDIMGGQTSGWGQAVLLLYSILGAPILEELAFRKVLLDKLHSYGEVTAAFTSALAFGLIHGNSTQFFLAFNVGLVFSVVYMKTGRIVYTMILHAIINTIASVPSILEIFGVNGETVAFADTALFVSLCVFVLIAAVLIPAKRTSPALALKRAQCPGMNQLAFRNVGLILFTVLISMGVAGLDLLNLIMNLAAGKGAKSLLLILPTALYFVSIGVFFSKVGKKEDALPAVEAEAGETEITES